MGGAEETGEEEEIQGDKCSVWAVVGI